MKKLGKVTNVKATGTQTVVEMLSNDEASGSKVFIAGQSHQAIVIHVGPAIETEKWGFKVGDRVLLQGNFVPLKEIPGRELAVVDPHTIKCVLLEE